MIQHFYILAISKIKEGSKIYKKQILLAMLILVITVKLGFADTVKFKSSSAGNDEKPLVKSKSAPRRRK